MRDGSGPEPSYDLLIKNLKVVRPGELAVKRQDVAIKDGEFQVLAGNP